MTTCPHCRGTGVQPNGSLDALRDACAELGIQIGWDNTIDEGGAALLVHRSKYTLRNWRLTDQRLPVAATLGGRARYALADVLTFIENSTEPY